MCYVPENKCTLFSNKHNAMASIKITEASIWQFGIIFYYSRDFIKFHLFYKTVQVVVPDLQYLIRTFYSY
jgi:hypothetical protein